MIFNHKPEKPEGRGKLFPSSVTWALQSAKEISDKEGVTTWQVLLTLIIKKSLGYSYIVGIRAQAIPWVHLHFLIQNIDDKGASQCPQLGKGLVIRGFNIPQSSGLAHTPT